MIHEWRSYRLKPGAAVDYLALFAEEGLPLVTRYLPLMGYWLAETGPLNAIHHLWSYADWSERESARAGLAGEDAWTLGFVPRAFPMIEEQTNRLMRQTRSSPAFDAALDRRLEVRRPVPARMPLFAARWACLQIGGTDDGAVAEWKTVSGPDDALWALRAPLGDPLAHPPPDGSSRIVLRPLAFSPL